MPTKTKKQMVYRGVSDVFENSDLALLMEEVDGVLEPNLPGVFTGPNLLPSAATGRSNKRYNITRMKVYVWREDDRREIWRKRDARLIINSGLPDRGSF